MFSTVKSAEVWTGWTYKGPATFHGCLLLYLGEHLLVFSLNELVVDVASRVKSGERLEGIFGSAFDHEPSETSDWTHEAILRV